MNRAPQVIEDCQHHEHGRDCDQRIAEQRKPPEFLVECGATRWNGNNPRGEEVVHDSREEKGAAQ